MSETVSSSFRIAETTDDHIWLKIDRGDARGFQVVIPTISVEYDEKLQREILNLEEGERIEATLRSENERNTAWHIQSIDKGPIDPIARRQTHADD